MKLKTLEIPAKSWHCANAVKAVAKAYHEQGITGEEARRRAGEAALRDGEPLTRQNSIAIFLLPFSELLVLCVQAGHYNDRYSFSLDRMIQFMGLPSIHRIILGGVRDKDEDFVGGSPDIPECTCSEIYF